MKGPTVSHKRWRTDDGLRLWFRSGRMRMSASMASSVSWPQVLWLGVREFPASTAGVVWLSQSLVQARYNWMLLRVDDMPMHCYGRSKWKARVRLRPSPLRWAEMLDHSRIATDWGRS